MSINLTDRQRRLINNALQIVLELDDEYRKNGKSLWDESRKTRCEISTIQNLLKPA